MALIRLVILKMALARVLMVPLMIQEKFSRTFLADSREVARLQISFEALLKLPPSVLMLRYHWYWKDTTKQN